MKYIPQFLAATLFVFFISGCTLYEKQEKELTTHVNSNGTKIGIYYIDMGATTKEVIQVRKSSGSNRDSVIRSFEKNCLQSSKFIDDSTLILVLKDTGSVVLDTTIVHY